METNIHMQNTYIDTHTHSPAHNLAPKDARIQEYSLLSTQSCFICLIPGAMYKSISRKVGKAFESTENKQKINIKTWHTSCNLPVSDTYRNSQGSLMQNFPLHYIKANFLSEDHEEKLNNF